MLNFVGFLKSRFHYKSKMNLNCKKTHSIANDYKIEKQVLGYGISGKVFGCVNRLTQEKYALKTLSNKSKSINEIELHMTACRECPYIVNIVDVYENIVDGKNVLLVVMELMSGGQLFETIASREQPFTEKEVAKIMLQICTAVKHLHDMNIAHRDLKPENLLLSSSGEDAIVKLIDFGFAKETNVNLGLRTPCYTPYYVAPEILKAEKYDKSCDIWSLGVIMYILCCGYPPFYSLSGHPISPGMRKRIKNASYDFPDKEWSKVSSEAKRLIESMLETNPDKRINIDQILNSKWINTFTRETPINQLTTVDVLKEDKDEWEHVTGAINTALTEMRIDSDKIEFKMSENKLYKKRLAKLQQQREDEEGEEAHRLS